MKTFITTTAITLDVDFLNNEMLDLPTELFTQYIEALNNYQISATEVMICSDDNFWFRQMAEDYQALIEIQRVCNMYKDNPEDQFDYWETEYNYLENIKYK